MSLRRSPVRDAVELMVDGDEVLAERGEPVAIALLAAGRRVLGRSVKYHRPRGPLCLEGRCDGCLMRVDGIPNVLACRVGAEAGMRVETQNVVGSARLDLLAAADWFFPGGLDHHHMLTRFGSLNRLMQKIARRVAGIGRLPEEALAPVPVRDRDVDVLVVGGGGAGISAANAAAREGASVLLVEEHALGGERALLGAPAPTLGPPVEVMLGAVVAAIYQEPAVGFAGRPASEEPQRWALVADDAGLCRVRFASVVVATGTDPVPLAIAGIDRAGVFSARAALRALRHEVAVGETVALVGMGACLDRVAASLGGAEVLGPYAPEQVHAIAGRPEVEAVVVDGRRIPCDAVVFDGARSAAYPVAAQAGAEVAWDGRGFVVRADDSGRTAAPGTYAVGRVTGRVDADEQARAAGRLAALRRGGGRVLERPLPRNRPALLPAQAADKVIVCRCEDVTLRDIEGAVQRGYRDIESVKRYTGFGTGWCQGKQCVAVCAQLIESAGGDDIERPFTARPPVRPLPLAHLARLVDDPEPR